jgi:hypothetical protein
VGIVGTVRFGGLCSGTLISPIHVLTAAHCAELAESPLDGTFELDGRLYTTSEIYIHPEYDGRWLTNDLAIYELSEVVEDVIPSPIYWDAPQVGQILTLVGYGAGGDGVEGDDGTFGVKMVGFTEIDQVTDTLVIWHFDNLDESNSAPGDSGGPAFLEIDGQFVVAAVISAGTEPDAILGDVAYNTRVDAYADWIDSVVLPGEPPIDEPPDEEPPPDQEPPDDESPDEPSQDKPGKCPPHNGHRPGHHFAGGGGHRPVPGFRPGSNKRPGIKKPFDGPRPSAGKRPTQSFRPSHGVKSQPIRAVNTPKRLSGRGEIRATQGSRLSKPVRP